MKKLLLIALCFLSFQANGHTIDTAGYQNPTKTIQVILKHGVDKIKELNDSVPNFTNSFGNGRFWKLNIKVWEKFGSEANGSNFELLEKISKIQNKKELISTLIGFGFAGIGAIIGYNIGKYYDDLESEHYTEYAENGLIIGAAISLIPSYILFAYLTQLPNSLADFKTS